LSIVLWKKPKPKQISKVNKETFEILTKPVKGYYVADAKKGTYQVVFDSTSADVAKAPIVFSCDAKLRRETRKMPVSFTKF